MLFIKWWGFEHYPLGTRRCCDVESTSMTLIQRRNNVVWRVGTLVISNPVSKLLSHMICNMRTDNALNSHCME